VIDVLESLDMKDSILAAKALFMLAKLTKASYNSVDPVGDEARIT
jgi:hypothetical protein